MHIAAMKPLYFNKEEVPKEERDKWLEEGKEKQVTKMYQKLVLMEQDLATSDESIRVKAFLKEKEKEVGSRVQVKDWALFTIY